MASPAELFQATPSLKKAATLINNLDSSKFSRLLTRVLQKLHLKSERVFTAEEEERLQSAFELEAKELELIITTSIFILQQAAYHLVKVSSFKPQLASLGLDEDKVKVFVETWSTHGKSMMEKLRSCSFYPKQLEELNWRLNLTMAQSGRSKLKQPNAVVELVLKEGQETDKVHVDFTHTQLFDFYTQLEKIQEQLDSLT